MLPPVLPPVLPHVLSVRLQVFALLGVCLIAVIAVICTRPGVQLLLMLQIVVPEVHRSLAYACLAAHCKAQLLRLLLELPQLPLLLQHEIAYIRIAAFA